MIEVHRKKDYFLNMKNIARHIFFTLLISCYAFIVSAEQHCISDRIPDYGKARHLAATSKQVHSAGSRFILKQGKNISSTPRIDMPTVAVLLDTKLRHNQSFHLVLLPLNIFRSTSYFYIPSLPRGPTIA
jgi:hypothetical protein